jgi:hypothetical protein
VFVGIVRRGLWHHLTSADEDRATIALKRDRERQARTIVKPSAAFELEVGEARIGEILDLVMRGSDTVIPYTRTKPAPALKLE